MSRASDSLQPQAGAPNVTSARVFAIAVPTAIGHITVPLLGIADTAFVGRLGEATLLAGIAIGTMVFEILFTVVNFLRSGTTALTAQAFGRLDWAEYAATLYRAHLVAISLGLVFITVQAPFFALVLPLMGGSQAVQGAALDYLSVRILSSPFALMNYVFLGWLIGQGRAVTALLLQAFINLSNITLSYLLTFPLGLGFIGVAWGTVAAETTGAAAGVLVAWPLLRARPQPARARVLAWPRFRALFLLNRDIMIRSLALIFAFAFFTAQGARQGELILAANAVLLHVFLFASYFLDGLAVAAEQLTGQSLGALRRDLFARAVKLASLWSFAIAAAITLAFFAGSELYITLITTDEAVRETARIFFPYAAITALCGVLAYIMDGVFIGATWSRDMRNMMLASLGVYLAVWWLAIGPLGNHGLWLAFLVFLGVRGLTLLAVLPRRMDESFTPGAAPVA